MISNELSHSFQGDARTIRSTPTYARLCDTEPPHDNAHRLLIPMTWTGACLAIIRGSGRSYNEHAFVAREESELSFLGRFIWRWRDARLLPGLQNRGQNWSLLSSLLSSVEKEDHVGPVVNVSTRGGRLSRWPVSLIWWESSASANESGCRLYLFQMDS